MQDMIPEMVQRLDIGPGKDFVGLAHFSTDKKSGISLPIEYNSLDKVNGTMRQLIWSIDTIAGITDLHRYRK